MAACSSSSAPAVDEINLRFLFKLAEKDKLVILNFWKDRGLLSPTYVCPTCSKNMRLCKRADSQDGYEWLCQVRKEEGKHRVRRTVRRGSWFSESHLDLCTTMTLTYMWCHKLDCQFISKELKVSGPTVTDWRSFCREVCVETVALTKQKIGGIGHIVEIDESKFGRRKFNRGRVVEGTWVFGGVERGTKKCFFHVVDDRTKDTLMAIIKDNILPGTTIISDCWRSYDALTDEGYQHFRVNHKYEFKNSQTGAHTNTIEVTWWAIKRTLKQQRIVKGQFAHYLAEYVWRHEHKGEDIFVEFCKAIATVYPPAISD